LNGGWVHGKGGVATVIGRELIAMIPNIHQGRGGIHKKRNRGKKKL